MVNWFQDLLLKIMPDDAFYYLQLANGHTKFTETNGYHPIWALLLAIPGHFFDSWTLVYIDVFLYYFIVLISPFILWKLYKTKWTFIYWTVPLLWRDAVGMEYALASLLLACAYKIRKPWVTSLMVLTRLDTAILAVMITRGWKNYLIVFGSLSLWLLWNFLVFHTIKPDSLIHDSDIRAWAFNFQSSLMRDAGVLSIVLMIYLFNKQKHLSLLAYMVILSFFDIIRSSTWQWHYVGMPLITFLGIYEFTKYQNYKIKFISTVTAILLTFITIRDVWPGQISMYRASFIHLDGTIGAYNSGIQGYFNTQKVYNLDGVFNHYLFKTDYVLDYERYVSKDYILISALDENKFGIFKKLP